MAIEKIKNGDQVIIRVSGQLKFSSHDEFRDAYQDEVSVSMSYVVDLSSAHYIDSSGLGMLLMLREHAGGDSSKIEIRGANDRVKKILEIASFGMFFKIA